MSHFTVLIIGNDVEEQLEPYFELECTMNQEEMKNDPRAEFVEEMTTEALTEDFLKTKNDHPEYYYETLEDFASEYHGYIKAEDEEVWGRFTNPKSKWDWYQIGGRWSGIFKIKDIEQDDTKEKYIEDSSRFSTYALVKEGEWYAKGEMGWWAVSSNEDENWSEEFGKMIKSLPEDTLLTLVDCHI